MKHSFVTLVEHGNFVSSHLEKANTAYRLHCLNETE